MLRNRTHTFLLALAILWCFLLLLPPIGSLLGHEQASRAAYHFFSRICHQDEARSLHLFDQQLAVCARCSMIYFGFLIGLIVIGFRYGGWKNFRLWFVAILLPMVLDVALDALGFHQTTMVTRVVTGIVFGIGSAVLLGPLLIEGIRQIQARLSWN